MELAASVAQCPGMTEHAPRQRRATRPSAEREAPRPDPLAPARGILLALALGGALWLALALSAVLYVVRA